MVKLAMVIARLVAGLYLVRRQKVYRQEITGCTRAKGTRKQQG